MDNQQIATVFEEIGQLLEIDGANKFRVLAYKNAAENIRGMGRELSEIWVNNPKELGELPGIGEDLKLKIEELLITGICKYHQNLLKKYGQGVLDILSIRTVGPKKAALFYHQLKIDNIEKLQKAALAGRLSKLPRMGEKSEKEILIAIEEHFKYSVRMLLPDALKLAKAIIQHLQVFQAQKYSTNKPIAKIKYAGSLRRRKETIGDIDILVSPFHIKDSQKIIIYFQKFPLVKNIIASGNTKSSVILQNGVQVDLRIVELNSFGTALHYFTGSKDHNIAIRTHAIKQNKKVNEYGIFQISKNNKGDEIETFITGESEKKFYQTFNFNYIPPVLRENKGELEASSKGKLPKLITKKDLKGDLNINTNYGTGKSTIAEILKIYQENNFQYICINDLYSPNSLISNLNNQTLEQQIEKVHFLQKQYPNLKIFHSIKIPINNDGSLNLPSNKLIQNLDFLTIKVNGNFTLPESLQNERIIKAINSHSKIKMISTLNARILNQREGIAINIEKIFNASKSQNIIFEINSQPNLLELTDNQIKLAVEQNIPLAINSDFTTNKDIKNLKYGAWTAQRGWAENKNIINTFNLKTFQKFLSK